MAAKKTASKPAANQVKLNIFQRINEVRKKVSYVKKDEKKIEGMYRAVTHDAVTAMLHDALVEFGIIIAQNLKHGRTIETGKKTKSGVPIIRYEATYEIAAINMDNPQDNLAISIEAHAEDTGDKAPGKAMSYGMKYFKLKVFDLETGEDDEGRIESTPQKLTPESHQKLKDVCLELDMDADKTLEALAVKVYKVEKITDINEQWSADAEKRLRAKAATE